MSKAHAAMRALPYNSWTLDNGVGVKGGKAQHRTWRPVEHGRPVYAQHRIEGGEVVSEGPKLYTLCGRAVYLNAPSPAKRCGVCFRP
jgi:hypothetical protein